MFFFAFVYVRSMCTNSFLLFSFFFLSKLALVFFFFQFKGLMKIWCDTIITVDVRLLASNSTQAPCTFFVYMRYSLKGGGE